MLNNNDTDASFNDLNAIESNVFNFNLDVESNKIITSAIMLIPAKKVVDSVVEITCGGR